MRTLIAIALTGLLVAPAISAPPTTTPADAAQMRATIESIRTRLPALKAQLDVLKSAGQDVSYPLVRYTVLDNFTGYALDDLNTSVPSGWGLNAVNGCDSKYEPAHDAHRGAWAAKIVTKSPQTPNVYGMFESDAVVTLAAGKPYTLSVWAKSDDPGNASMPLDGSWANRLKITATNGAWKRFEQTFTPGSGDLAFKPRVLSESAAAGLLIDDVCLVEGDAAEAGKNLIPNGSFETSWSAKRAGRELPDMEAMADRLTTQLADASAGRITLPKVPRWDGAQRPKIVGPSFIADGRPNFFIGYGHFKQVREDIEKFPAYGINIVQHGEMGPKQVFLKEGAPGDAALNKLIDELDRAAKSGVAVDFLISPHYFPDWFFAKYPKLRVPRADFFPWSIYAPQGRALVKEFVEYVIPKIKDKPALLSICLSNEPINCQDPDEYSTAAWRAWLKQRHGDIGALNERWKTNYRAFDEIPQPNALNKSAEPRPGAAWCDFVRWNQQYFAEFHKALADMVHAVAPNLPVHAKATTWHAYRSDNIMSGDDPTLLGGVTDINGNDSVNLWSFSDRSGDLIERGTKDFAQGWRENALAYELQRSVHNAPVFNSENHLIFDRDGRYVAPAHVRSALWMGAIHGQSATTLWVWERERFNPQSDLSGDIMERASCAEAIGNVCLDLNRVAEQVTAIQNAMPDVLILHSNTSAVWDGHQYDGAMMKLFTALSFTGLKIGFVTEWQLEQHRVSDGRILFVPGCVHLSDAAFKGLGLMQGQIIFAGGERLLTRNEYDQPRSERVTATTMQLGKTWQDTLKAIGPVLEKARIAPAIEVKSDGGDWGVQWQTARTPDGLVVNLYNARHDPISVTVGDGACVDLLTGQTIAAGEKITLQPMEVRLVRVEQRPPSPR